MSKELNEMEIAEQTEEEKEKEMMEFEAMVNRENAIIDFEKDATPEIAKKISELKKQIKVLGRKSMDESEKDRQISELEKQIDDIMNAKVIVNKKKGGIWGYIFAFVVFILFVFAIITVILGVIWVTLGIIAYVKLHKNMGMFWSIVYGPFNFT
jgi:predicted phage tail protein